MSLHNYIIIVTISLPPITEKSSQMLSAMAMGNGDFQGLWNESHGVTAQLDENIYFFCPC